MKRLNPEYVRNGSSNYATFLSNLAGFIDEKTEFLHYIDELRGYNKHECINASQEGLTCRV